MTPNESSSFLRRRDLSQGAVAGSLSVAAGGLYGRQAPAAEPGNQVAALRDASLIARENARQGARDWQLTRVRLDRRGGFRSPWIEGYCSRQSVRAGDTLDIMVSTAPAEKFQIEVFRTGYYGGRGARLMTTLGPLEGKTQPVPPIGEKNLRECRWEPSVQLKIPADWPSGVYLGRLSLLPATDTQAAWQSYVVFIVRDDRPADILLQCSDNTWQAYNRWPDNYSVYTHPKGNQGPWADVSFDRPYAKYAQIYENPQSVGSGEWLCFEFPFAYWLEQHGYDVTYCSNADMLTPDHGLKCKAFLSVGHDEYWDIRQYESVVQMRDAGVNLLFFSGNSVCWVTPLRESSSGIPNRIFLVPGPFPPAGPHIALVALEPAARSGRARATDHPQPVATDHPQPVAAGDRFERDGRDEAFVPLASRTPKPPNSTRPSRAFHGAKRRWHLYARKASFVRFLMDNPG